MKVAVRDLRPGDVIMPPAREVSLWMRRTLEQEGLAEEALYLTVIEVKEGRSDRNGSWIVVKAIHTPEWLARYTNSDPMRNPFTFKARPDTQWATIQQVAR